MLLICGSLQQIATPWGNGKCTFDGSSESPAEACAIWGVCVVSTTADVLFAAESRCIAGLQDKNYAFLEFRSVEEASNCMAFDGVVFNNTYLRVSLWALLYTL